MLVQNIAFKTTLEHEIVCTVHRVRLHNLGPRFMVLKTRH